MKSTKNLLGRKLKMWRKNLGFTQQDVAVALEIPRHKVSEIENGKRLIKAMELYTVARFFNATVEQIIEG